MFKKLFLILSLSAVLCGFYVTNLFAFTISDIPNNTIKLGDDFFAMSSSAMMDSKAVIPIQSLLNSGVNKNKAYFKFGGLWFDVFKLTPIQFLNPSYAMSQQQVDSLSGFNKWYKPGNEIVDLTTPVSPPSIPQNLKAESGNGSVLLTWDSISGAIGYKVFMSEAVNGVFTETAVISNSYIAQGLQKGKSYYFKVKSTNGSLESAFSDLVNAIANIDISGNIYNGKYLLVSNESTNIASSQPSGTLPSIMAMLKSVKEGAGQETYAIDPLLPIPEEGKDGMVKNIQKMLLASNVGDRFSFQTINFYTGKAELVSALLLYQGTYCNVWVEATNIAITATMAEQMGKEYDNRMYPLITNNFHGPSDVDGDGRVAILCFDIQDGFSGSGGYVGGYFNPRDLFQNTASNPSNQMEVLYIDTYPTMGLNKSSPIISGAFSTIVHELQHEGNLVDYLIDPNQAKPMEVWLNEALSMAAEHMYNGVQNSRINYYNISSGIANGRSLLFWDNNNDVLANYALSYLFSQYLCAQTKNIVPAGASIFKEIIQDSNYDYRAVENLIHKYIGQDMSFQKFMTCFRTALSIKATTGLYGFNGDTGFNNIYTPLYGGNSINLIGGGAILVDVPTNSFMDPGNKGSDIKYIGLFE